MKLKLPMEITIKVQFLFRRFEKGCEDCAAKKMILYRVIQNYMMYKIMTGYVLQYSNRELEYYRT